MTFPKDFAWGAATAAFQIEGATTVDGRGESIWDRFARTPGKVHNGDTGDPACEHYYRWREDLDLMSSLGLRAYRFSISWPRIQPDGRGPANQRGLDFYRRLVEGLRERGIAPLVTLYHWDLPQALEDDGGWAVTRHGRPLRRVRRARLRRSRRSGRGLDDAQRAVGDLLPRLRARDEGSRCNRLAARPPGGPPCAAVARDGRACVPGQRAERAGSGLTLDLTVARPFTDDDEDRAAARRLEAYHNGWFLDPIFRGEYPPELLELYEGRFGPLDAIHPGDLETIAQPLDYLGVNFYRPNLVTASDDGSVLGLAEVPQEAAKTAMGWPVVPEALTELLVGLKRDYGDLPLLITENGAAFVDRRNGADVVEDPSRVAYIERHLAAVEQAIAAGVDVRGYFVWSLLDNFEWEHGYSQRFGIVYVDFETQRRIPKRSALWYRDRIAAATGEVA